MKLLIWCTDPDPGGDNGGSVERAVGVSTGSASIVNFDAGRAAWTWGVPANGGFVYQ